MFWWNKWRVTYACRDEKGAIKGALKTAKPHGKSLEYVNSSSKFTKGWKTEKRSVFKNKSFRKSAPKITQHLINANPNAPLVLISRYVLRLLCFFLFRILVGVDNEIQWKRDFQYPFCVPNEFDSSLGKLPNYRKVN